MTFSTRSAAGRVRADRSAWRRWSAPCAAAPRQPGASMLVGPTARPWAACPAAASRARSTSWPPRCVGYRRARCCSATGVSDDDAFAVGLTCGGIIDIFVEPVVAGTLPGFARRRRRVRRRGRAGGRRHRDRAGARRAARRAAGGLARTAVDGTLGQRRGWTPRVRRRRARAARTPGRTAAAALRRRTGERRGDGHGRSSSSRSRRRPRMIVFGAIDFAAAVARLGSFLGYRVTVCDARPVFATAEAVPRRHEVVVEWPHRYLAAAGGGRPDRRADGRSACSPTTRSSTCRCWRWRCGCPTSPTSARWARGAPTRTGWPGCARPASPRRNWPGCTRPIGLDLGARTPEETAVVDRRGDHRGRAGAVRVRMLRTTGGAIHRDTVHD